ncbi:MAG: hypothetical protein CMM94_01465 [Rickettsiales bacterium]|mgnify:FL=1|nr:hypothetical protein [Rickettsiales bacterium]
MADEKNSNPRGPNEDYNDFEQSVYDQARARLSNDPTWALQLQERMDVLPDWLGHGAEKDARRDVLYERGIDVNNPGEATQSVNPTGPDAGYSPRAEARYHRAAEEARVMGVGELISLTIHEGQGPLGVGSVAYDARSDVLRARGVDLNEPALEFGDGPDRGGASYERNYESVVRQAALLSPEQLEQELARVSSEEFQRETIREARFDSPGAVMDPSRDVRRQMDAAIDAMGDVLNELQSSELEHEAPDGHGLNEEARVNAPEVEGQSR